MKSVLLLGGMLLTLPVMAAEERPVNDFSTQTRVEYVLGCMSQYGGENYDNMYHCACAIDKIAALMSHDTYISSTTLAAMIDTPGERSGVFRDATGGRKAVRAFQQTLRDAEASCGLHVRTARKDG
ncbi:MAG: hypothetical protein KDI15_09595 [Thiothrix sp.]|nr:hypothetical protein [Thiothrix sp.]HPE58740.1 hypothetical protein [Thiolinea sp.]